VASLTERFRPQNIKSWIRFNIALGTEFERPSVPHFKIPVFTEKILVFNKDISSDLFAYIEDEYMEEEAGVGYFTEGLPSKADLVKQYWKSMLPVKEYLNNKPYKDPEILIFETVPKELFENIK
jgi:hypothetical protein